MDNRKTRLPMEKEIVFALRDIKDKYPQILPAHIDLFAPIYYPIALVEMNLEEMTFEDFETIQLVVLKLIGLGQSQDQIISDLLGLSPNYIYKIKHLLMGYGHIDAKGVTPLGQESILKEKKIVKAQVWQKFQVDALNGKLIKINQIVSDNMLNSKDKTSFIVGHLDYLDGITKETIVGQLQSQDYNHFIKQKSGVLNTNVLAINEVECSEVKYARCFLMKLKGLSEPIIFAKRYDKDQREIKDRFSWQPFSLPDGAFRSKYGFEEAIPISNDLTKDYTNNIYQMLLERSQHVDLEKEAYKVLRKVYPFQEEGVFIGGYKPNNTLIVNVDERAFKKQTSWLPHFIKQLKDQGEYLVTNQHLYGKMISLQSQADLTKIGLFEKPL